MWNLLFYFFLLGIQHAWEHVSSILKNYPHYFFKCFFFVTSFILLFWNSSETFLRISRSYLLASLVLINFCITSLYCLLHFSPLCFQFTDFIFDYVGSRVYPICCIFYFNGCIFLFLRCLMFLLKTDLFWFYFYLFLFFIFSFSIEIIPSVPTLKILHIFHLFLSDYYSIILLLYILK